MAAGDRESEISGRANHFQTDHEQVCVETFGLNWSDNLINHKSLYDQDLSDGTSRCHQTKAIETDINPGNEFFN